MIRILSSDLPSRSTNITYTTQKMHLIKDPYVKIPNPKLWSIKVRQEQQRETHPGTLLPWALLWSAWYTPKPLETTQQSEQGMKLTHTSQHSKAFLRSSTNLRKSHVHKKTHAHPMHRNKLCSTTYIEVKSKQVGWNTLSVIQDFNAFHNAGQISEFKSN
jgi:hypothetical protein